MPVELVRLCFLGIFTPLKEFYRIVNSKLIILSILENYNRGNEFRGYNKWVNVSRGYILGEIFMKDYYNISIDEDCISISLYIEYEC